jgi:hypothetical protein
MGEVEELPKREILGMRCHNVQKPGFDFGIAEGAELADFAFRDAHSLEAKDRSTQASAGLFKKPARTI